MSALPAKPEAHLIENAADEQLRCSIDGLHPAIHALLGNARMFCKRGAGDARIPTHHRPQLIKHYQNYDKYEGPYNQSIDSLVDALSGTLGHDELSVDRP